MSKLEDVDTTIEELDWTAVEINKLDQNLAAFQKRLRDIYGRNYEMHKRLLAYRLSVKA